MRYKIIDMHSADAYYRNKDRFINKIIEPTGVVDCRYNDLGKEGWKFVNTDKHSFLAIKLKAVRKYTKKEKVNANS